MLQELERVAVLLRAAQKAAIAAENAPERRKRLRQFSVQEAAGFLGLSRQELKRARSRTGLRLTFEEMQAARRAAELENPPPTQRNIAAVTFANFKGGSAKTTTSVHFAQYLALVGYRVLLIDLDSQASATAQFGLEPATEVGIDNSFAAWVAAWEEGRALDPGTLPQPTYWPTVDLLPAGAALAEAEDRLSRSPLGGGKDALPAVEVLRALIQRLAGRYDVVVVDTRPDVNMLMTAALHATTGLVVPTRATMTDLSSTGEFFAHLASYDRQVAEALGSGLGLGFVRLLVTAYDPLDRSQEALVSLIREQFGALVLAAEFLHSRVVGTAGFGKETLYEYEPTTDRAAYQRVLASVNAVNEAIEAELIRLLPTVGDQELGQ